MSKLLPRLIVAVALSAAALVALLGQRATSARAAWQSEALATLHRFQEALRRGQRDAARELVAASSRPYVDELPAPKASGDVQLLAARRQQARAELRVCEPEAAPDATEGTFASCGSEAAGWST